MAGSLGDTARKRRVPWLALHTIPVRPEVRSGLMYIARSASLSRFVCVCFWLCVCVCMYVCIHMCVCIYICYMYWAGSSASCFTMLHGPSRPLDLPAVCFHHRRRVRVEDGEGKPPQPGRVSSNVTRICMYVYIC
jgi:hypothetical protein